MRVRRTISLLYFGTYTIVIFQFLQSVVLTGPVIKRSIRMVREVYPEIEADKHEGNQAEVCIVGDVVYGADEPVPSDQPCLKCKCQPPGVQCEAIQCSQKQGCKAIHKSNRCCPEYQCECVHNGTVYGNGERLATLPGGECSVCYCRGGEVQCANVSCYIRSDCEGRTVPGQCCPKYDHCPLKEPIVDRSTSRIVPAVTEKVSFTTAIYDVQELSREDNKITDTHSTVATELITEPKDASNNNQVNVESDNTKASPNITIQEIIPEIKEIPITTAPKQNINALVPKTHAPATETLIPSKDKQTTSDLIIADAESESSEILEIYHQPPPVLKIGDQLLIFKKGELVSEKDISTPVPVITIIGAEGLQRGTEDNVEFHEIFSQLQGPQKDIGNFDDFFENETSSNREVSTKETHIVSFVKQKKVTSTPTPEPFTDLPPSLLEFEEVASEASDYSVNQTGLPANIETSTVLINSTFEAKTVESVEAILENKTNIENIMEAQDLNKFEDADVMNSTSDFQNAAALINSSDLSSLESLRQSVVANTVPLSNDSLSIDNQDQHSENTSHTKTYFSAHILINSNATLPSTLLRQAAVSDLDSDNFTEHNEPQTISTDTVVLLNQLATTNSTENTKDVTEEISGDSGESTTAKSNQTLELLSTENASIETTQNDSRELDTTDMVEILPGFQITTENVENKEEKFKNETHEFPTTTKSVIDVNKSSETTDEDILKQLNKELNNTFSSLNFTAFQNEQAIFKELLEEVSSPTLPPNAANQDSTLHQLHEKESQLLLKVSEAISKFQSKESKEALDARIMRILKDFFSTQHKFDSNKTQPVPVLPTIA